MPEVEQLTASNTCKENLAKEFVDGNVPKSIEHLKAHILKGYPDYPEFIESIKNDTKDV